MKAYALYANAVDRNMLFSDEAVRDNQVQRVITTRVGSHLFSARPIVMIELDQLDFRELDRIEVILVNQRSREIVLVYKN